MERPDFSCTAQIGCCLSIACSLAGAFLGFVYGAYANQYCHGYPDGKEHCSYPNNGDDLPIEWTIDGAIIGCVAPLAITLCCLCGQLAKYECQRDDRPTVACSTTNRNATDSSENKDLSDKNNEYVPSISPPEQKQSSCLTAGFSALFSSIKGRISGYQPIENMNSRNIPQF